MRAGCVLNVVDCLYVVFVVVCWLFLGLCCWLVRFAFVVLCGCFLYCSLVCCVIICVTFVGCVVGCLQWFVFNSVVLVFFILKLDVLSNVEIVLICFAVMLLVLCLCCLWVCIGAVLCVYWFGLLVLLVWVCLLVGCLRLLLRWCAVLLMCWLVGLFVCGVWDV